MSVGIYECRSKFTNDGGDLKISKGIYKCQHSFSQMSSFL